MIKNELWYLLIDGQKDTETGIVGNFYAYGDHLGDALDKTIKASVEYKFANHNLAEASLLENFDVIDNSNELVKISDNVYMRPTTYTYPFDDPDKEFIPPIGVVKSVDEGEYEYDLIMENFVAYGANDNGVFELELVLTKQNLIDTFFKTIEFIPTIDGFWVYVRNYWESDLTELWVAKHFTDKHSVIDFLKTQKINTLENGYLDIVVHSLLRETNLTLDAHKKYNYILKTRVYSVILSEI
ncbi:hypothetical protein [Niabella hibiscisoli]|uniref:hypothetical protein n=1 Tax=Niabella hibiscisoli TaxID=1825928 RepID=UPI001F0F22D5|nr:hypothetical protein [Niabella hibiscisoli]MCH5715578.1 hypothetical protein [Niabella hibiscisoli]